MIPVMESTQHLLSTSYKRRRGARRMVTYDTVRPGEQYRSNTGGEILEVIAKDNGEIIFRQLDDGYIDRFPQRDWDADDRWERINHLENSATYSGP